MTKTNYQNLRINHSEQPIRLFKSDFLEFFSHIHPSAVLIVYVPLVGFCLWTAIVTQPSNASWMPIYGAYLAGLFAWTFAEYFLHRHLFHFEPSSPRLKRVWYLLHGVHHEQPQCKTRLVLPPVISLPLALVFYLLFHQMFGVLLGVPLWTMPFFAGFVTGYIVYDMSHYAVHHLSLNNKVFKFLKRYHQLHHYQTPDGRFGITSPLWDSVFGTRPKD